MRLVIIALIVIALAAAPSSAGQVELGADLDNVFWLTDANAQPQLPYTLSWYYNGSSWGPSAYRFKTVVFDPSSLPAWAGEGEFYAVVCYSKLDPAAGANTLTLRVAAPGMPYPHLIIILSSPPTTAATEKCVASPGSYDTSVLEAGVITLSIEGPKPSKADWLSITITKIGIAPPEGALDANSSTEELAAQAQIYWSGNMLGYVLLGLGALIIILLVLAFARRW